jgi:hypothetical protein
MTPFRLDRAVALLVASGLVSACSVKALPPGTPPPEYETRSFEPWPPVTPDAGADDAPDAAAELADAAAEPADAAAEPADAATLGPGP